MIVIELDVRRRAPPRQCVRPTRARARSCGSATTSVASAVVATGPGTRALAASSTIAHRSSMLPPAPPHSSGTATPNKPRSARPPKTGRQAFGSPCSIARTAAVAPDVRSPIAHQLTRRELFVGDGGRHDRLLGHCLMVRFLLSFLPKLHRHRTRTCSNSASDRPSSRMPSQQDISVSRRHGGEKFALGMRIVSSEDARKGAVRQMSPSGSEPANTGSGQPSSSSPAQPREVMNVAVLAESELGL